MVAGLDDCVDGNFVFREWASSWARRILIRNAIRIVAPHADGIRPMPVALHSTVRPSLRRIPLGDSPFAGVLKLEDFERFVFVLSVLERYTDHNCAALLGTSKRIVQEARIRVLMHIADIHGIEGVHVENRYPLLRLDKQLKRGTKLKPLQCIPVVLRDNFDTADMPTISAHRWHSTACSRRRMRLRWCGSVKTEP